MPVNEKVVVRFAPSPTGFLHMGGVRTALYNYIFAKQSGGKLLLRIEDTDKERSKKEYEEDIINGLKWTGITYEQMVLKQSERTDIYKNAIQKLIKNGAAYISNEETGENKQVVRFKNPCLKIKFEDLIRGEVEMDTTDLKDFIIAKSIDEPLYHLAVVVDDIESEITHIIRGEDHLSNTPRQILIAKALGKENDFKFVHLPLVLAEDKSKLSKRKHGETVSLKHYIDKGYESEAILNFLALIGWNPGTDQEIFNLEELVQVFDLSKVQKKGGVFNIEKLNWINKEHITHQPHELQIENLKSQIAKTKWKDSEKLEDQHFVEKFLKIILERIHRWGEVGESVEAGEFDYLFSAPVLDKDKICWKNQDKQNAKENLEKILSILGDPSPLQGEGPSGAKGGEVEQKIMSFAEKMGKGGVLWPLRYSLSGKEKSPGPETLLQILGLDESKSRIQNAIKLLSE